MNWLPLSELHLLLGKSNLYFRLVVTLYVITFVLIAHTSFYLVIKLSLVLIILVQLRIDYIQKKPHLPYAGIHYTKNKWLLLMNSGESLHYDQLKVLIHTPLFQVFKLVAAERSQLFILFNDQIPSEQLRILHFISCKNGL